jgi:NADH:ubiquinone oxidoreductase subunit 4 (subunit M)
MQFVEKMPWIERFNVHYHLGVDGISLWLVLLTAFITVIVVMAGWEVITERVATSTWAPSSSSRPDDRRVRRARRLLFYVFFEATLIPMYLIIGVWGGPNRVYAAFKFFLYTLLGSLLMLVALIVPVHQERRQLRHRRPGTAALPLTMTARRRCCSSPSSPPSRSRCRCGRCTPGCPMCTSRRPRAAPPCWRPSC